MLTWAQRTKLSNREIRKLGGKTSDRVTLLVGRCYLYGCLEKPLEQVTNEEFLSCYGVGPKTLEDIRKVVPQPLVGKEQ